MWSTARSRSGVLSKVRNTLLDVYTILQSESAAVGLERAKASVESPEKSRTSRPSHRGTRCCHHFNCGGTGRLLPSTALGILLGKPLASTRSLGSFPLDLPKFKEVVYSSYATQLISEAKKLSALSFFALVSQKLFTDHQQGNGSDFVSWSSPLPLHTHSRQLNAECRGSFSEAMIRQFCELNGLS